uniref:Uncharacterized protein n=2 Tax=Lepeophtheirus salmonis TaxID=72036 RepID=A0A0K2T6N2_LEPSM
MYLFVALRCIHPGSTIYMESSRLFWKHIMAMGSDLINYLTKRLYIWESIYVFTMNVCLPRRIPLFVS